MTTEMINSLTAQGFNRWTKNGKDRLYINASTLGLVCSYRKSGSISEATFRGNSISNNRAAHMEAAKTYIDLNNNMIVSDDADLAAAVAEMIGIDYSAGSRQISIA